MKKILLGIFLFLGLSFIQADAQEPVEIDHYKLNIVVDDSGFMTVDHELDVTFNTPRQGIFAYIPQAYTMNWIINDQMVEKSYYFPVRNIRVQNDRYEKETDELDNIFLKIGEEGRYIEGPKTYRYSYTVQLRDLDLNGKQIFYWNLVGSGWQMPINQLEFNITLPKGFPNPIIFYSDPYGGATQVYPDVNFDGHTIHGIYRDPLLTHQAFTIFTELPDDYFSFTGPADYSPQIVALALVLLVSVILIHQRYGRDEPLIETVEFNPIEGLSAGQAGYIYDNKPDPKDVISLIIEWGYKGYLHIEEDGKDFTLTKLKEIDESELRLERTVFNSIFRKDDVVTSNELKNSFYNTMNTAMMSYSKHFWKKQNRLYSHRASFFKLIFALLAFVPLALLVGNAIYRHTYREGISFGLAIAVYVIGTLISWLFYTLIKTRLYTTTPVKYLLGFILILVLTGYSFGVFMLYVYYPINLIALIGTLAATFFLILVNAHMHQRTAYGREMLGKIMGLRTFIELAEKDRLEALVHDDPSYFYKILPYAYVLGISSVWIDKFKDIAIPNASFYNSTSMYSNPYLMMRGMNRTFSSMQQVMTSVPVSARTSSGGGSFGGGGGFSGGGSSGGGFGGGGGGSW